MTLYHVNPKTGEPGPCKAQFNCPFGSSNEHYSSLAEAREAYAKTMSTFLVEALAKKAKELSEWRSIPWEKRKKILENFARKVVAKSSVHKKRKLRIVWEADFKERGKLGGSGFKDGDSRKTPQIRLPEQRLELLEEYSAYEDVLHEIAHLDAGMDAEHDENWRAAAKNLANKVNVLEWHDFPEGSILSPQESFRLNYLWYQKRVPLNYGVCENDPNHRLVDYWDDTPATCAKCDDEGKDGYLRLRWKKLKTDEHKEKWIFDRISEERAYYDKNITSEGSSDS